MDRKKPVVSEKKKSKRGVANLLILPSRVFLTGVFTPLRPQPLLLLLLCPTFAQGLAAFSSPTSSLFLRHSGDCDLQRRAWEETAASPLLTSGVESFLRGDLVVLSFLRRVWVVPLQAEAYGVSTSEGYWVLPWPQVEPLLQASLALSCFVYIPSSAFQSVACRLVPGNKLLVTSL